MQWIFCAGLNALLVHFSQRHTPLLGGWPVGDGGWFDCADHIIPEGAFEQLPQFLREYIHVQCVRHGLGRRIPDIGTVSSDDIIHNLRAGCGPVRLIIAQDTKGMAIVAEHRAPFA